MQMTAAEEFVKCLANLLEEGMCDEAQIIFEKERIAVIRSVTSELVSVTAKYLTEFNAQYESERFECCKAILNTIAEKCNPMETVLDFLEQIECMDNDIKFCAMLNPLRICMIKMKDKEKAIEWCVSTIKSYIEDLPFPNGDPDRDDAINNRIITVYTEILSFLEPLVKEAVKINSKHEERSLLEDYLLSLLISFYGKPFCYLSKSSFEKVSYKVLTKNIITLASCLTGDILYFLDIVSKRYRNIIRNAAHDKDVYTKNYECIMLFESSNNISNLAYAHFYFHIITEKNHWKNVPQVYTPYYIFETCGYLFKVLLCDEREISISTGLTFMEYVVKQTPPCSINSEMLGLGIYLDLFEPLITVMIYYDNDKERKKAVNVFQKYVDIFDMKARYSVISHLYETSEHSGLLSLIINIFKSSIIACLDSTPQSSYFLGKNMESMLKKICNLSHGSSSDLVEISDEIITSLNLLRFLFIRDQNNETGVWNITNILQTHYLKQLREGIDLCKAHWKVKLKDLKQQQIHDYCTKIQDYNQMKKNHAEVTLIIGGEELPCMPISQKITVCYQALNSLDVMESILIRVNECINVGKRC
ncbi:glomulin [Linepithema humile]|uniref:glomulin n=1 Tax=Linepithema humile TaxID=83485 RepID=UPI000623482E|nr:PREDICTED: glomulin [Linepithema humile]